MSLWSSSVSSFCTEVRCLDASLSQTLTLKGGGRCRPLPVCSGYAFRSSRARPAVRASLTHRGRRPRPLQVSSGFSGFT